MAVAIIAIAPELNIDLGYLEVLGLGRNAADKQGGRHQYRNGKRTGSAQNSNRARRCKPRSIHANIGTTRSIFEMRGLRTRESALLDLE